ncbi:hypothetical protein CDQ71_01565 [Campylobacter hyointestinalis subsp. hyointestinalis]|nr:hypothetical protein CDQ71_01565 [Campylobacter hyointestinalis subsp. hyointestinalis]
MLRKSQNIAKINEKIGLFMLVKTVSLNSTNHPHKNTSPKIIKAELPSLTNWVSSLKSEIIELAQNSTLNDIKAALKNVIFKSPLKVRIFLLQNDS